MTPSVSSFANVDPDAIGKGYIVRHLLHGEWIDPDFPVEIADPLHGGTLCRVDQAQPAQFYGFADQLGDCPTYGRHNPLYNVGRYTMLGEVFRKVGNALLDPDVADFFARLIQRCMPKSLAQCHGEVKVTALGFVNFSGDNVRFMARSFGVSGDHNGQESRGYRWPFGPVMIIAPFNFPLEIPALQLLGALAMGNLPLLKCDPRVAIVMEQFIRLLIACGLPREDVILMHADGVTTQQFVEQNAKLIRLLQFTGSSRIYELLAKIMGGRIKGEDAGFDWKILGPDFHPNWLPYVAWQSDQDAYAASGQKCSAQSVVFAHRNWLDGGLVVELAHRAALRKLDDLTIGPVLTWTTEDMLDHIAALLRIPGAKLLFGGRALTGHTIPVFYGAIEPTAVQVPLAAFANDEFFRRITTEVFGPLYVAVEWDDGDLETVLGIFESLDQRLTAAVVSRDQVFINEVLGRTNNGTTYAGIRARTTGAPQNHFFGPAGDPRAAGIGTPEAIRDTWSGHRELIHDVGPLPVGWTLPDPT
ncbi:MAG: aldehyde dehydrogenase family protein [Candidatus Kerfeldbacteria bacterium]|nr:aldehyde dehydrogenase family protein [Candidatus Kerfeldbacteria bacterium]